MARDYHKETQHRFQSHSGHQSMCERFNVQTTPTHFAFNKHLKIWEGQMTLTIATSILSLTSALNKRRIMKKPLFTKTRQSLGQLLEVVKTRKNRFKCVHQCFNKRAEDREVVLQLFSQQQRIASHSFQVHRL